MKRNDFHFLFKTKDKNAARFATIHNVFLFNNLMKQIRKSVLEGRFLEFKKSFLAKVRWC